jgi:dUTP pyrophosphatase
MLVEIFRIDESLPLPKYETEGSFAFDFLAREETTIFPHEIGFVPGNVIIKCPKNLALLIIPRSSTPRKKSLVFPHSIGLIDGDYHGEKDEILIQVYNVSRKKVTVKKGERIAQGLFVKTEKVQFDEVHTPGEISRGGFGSTDQSTLRKR